MTAIQESKLTAKSRSPNIQNYTLVRHDRRQGPGGGLLFFIHNSVSFTRKSLSTTSKNDPHLKELTISIAMDNTELLITNVYIPLASSCNGRYSTPIEITKATSDHKKRQWREFEFVASMLLLLFAFRDLWNELGESNFQIFSQDCLFHHRLLESLEHFNVLLYIMLSTMVSFLEDTILFLQVSFFCTFHFFRKYTLHVCYVFNVI